ncbi:MAG: hypothetical protein RL885_09650 [Planctomycetota bacterium]
MRKNRATASGGFILVEILTALAILSLVLTMATEGFIATSRSQAILSIDDTLGERLRKIGERMSNYLRSAELKSVIDVPSSPNESNTIGFRRIIGFDQLGDPIFGPTERFFTEEFADPSGVSHQRLLWRSGAQKTVWAPQLAKVAFSRVGKGLQIELVAAETAGAEDEVVSRSTIHVALQN